MLFRYSVGSMGGKRHKSTDAVSQKMGSMMGIVRRFRVRDNVCPPRAPPAAFAVSSIGYIYIFIHIYMGVSQN